MLVQNGNWWPEKVYWNGVMTPLCTEKTAYAKKSTSISSFFLQLFNMKFSNMQKNGKSSTMNTLIPST